MGKGDKKTRRGKLFQGSFGVRRQKKSEKSITAAGRTETKPVATPEVKEVIEGKEVKEAKAVKETAPAKPAKAASPAKKETKPKKQESPE